MSRPETIGQPTDTSRNSTEGRFKLSSLSAFVPVCDEVENLAGVVRELLETLPAVADVFELCIVDDGSRDGTGALADQLARSSAQVRVVRHEANHGYGAAVRSGLAAARLEFVFFTDGDRQFDARDLFGLVAALGDADAAVGYRQARADPWYRVANAYLWSWIVRGVLGITVRDVNCAFKLFRRSALEPIALEASGGAVSAELMAMVVRAGGRVIEVPVRHRPRSAGRPSGARPGVILRSLVELLFVRKRLGRLQPMRRERRTLPGTRS